ncbi:MAG: molybdopterin-dependent oxidoreductase [Thermoflexales bacterium]|nr:molybdopterin-dependent oxidoreductase [Thermoflexales bacterium]
MIIHLHLNGHLRELSVAPGESLLEALRRAGYYSVKHGCETGDCGACGVLLKGPNDARPVMTNSCVMLAAQADGASITTLESLGNRDGLSPLQEAFIDNGAIQCGFCSPAQILAAKALLDREPNPTEAEIRDAISGVLCRCTGYAKPVQAILNAARELRGEGPAQEGPSPLYRRVIADGAIGDVAWGPGPGAGGPGTGAGKTATQTATHTRVDLDLSAEPGTSVVGKPERKVDAGKLAQGKPAFVDDMTLPGMLYAAMLTSPHAHARILDIRTDKALALPGVHAVLTYKNVKRVIYASGGQSYPNPPPLDQVSLDNKVRHVGDRVAVVAAESYELARQACALIEVDYDPLPAVFDADEAAKPGAPIIHDEPDALMIKDARRNLVAQVHGKAGDPDKAFAESDYVIEREYRVHQVQQAHIEPHICMTWFDEDDRLVIRTSTQVPFHVRRMISPLIGLPVKRIRVVKPRVGGGFGGKQEMLIEDLCAHLTLATGRPVRFELRREEEFTSSRSRHPQRMVFKLGFKRDPAGGAPLLHGFRHTVVADTGAYGAHGLTVQSVTGLRGSSSYRCYNAEYQCDIYYTNKPVPGAFRGYGAPQALFGLECAMDEAAADLGVDPIELRRKNWIRVGDPLPLARALGEGREGFEQVVKSCATEQCFQQGMAAIDWDTRDARRIDPTRPHIRRGVGCAYAMHGSAIAGLDMGAASIKMNDDGSFNVLVGGTDIGTGSDTVIGQIVAESLGVPLEDIIMYSSDTDFTPFDTGAYASSTTYITGGAAKKAAAQVGEQICAHAAHMFNSGRRSDGDRLVTEKALPPVEAATLSLRNRHVYSPDGRALSLAHVALHATHQENQHQIMSTASHMSFESPPPFAAQFVECEVDTRTGEITVSRMVMAVDCGVAINPATSTGQIEGGNLQALGYGHSEEMVYDDKGRVLNTRLGPYRIYSADETPEMQAILVQTYEPSGPYGAKAVAEIPIDAVAPALVNALAHATGVRMRSIPLTPERVWRALRAAQA